ncbi:MAG: restriction endonuclease [Bacteroidetes bacterium]|nr:MAG: restriction endonuclease [Bacteroidota bacterium]
MKKSEKNAIIKKFKVWFKDTLILNHKINTEKLENINKFNINPLLLYYLAYYLQGNATPISLAKVLVYPRVLSTSITTSFGTSMQSFITDVLGAYGSGIEGLDIEFFDHIDKEKKYCQIKSGPNSINKDDVVTIKGHFRAFINRARTNRLKINLNNIAFCLIYGEDNEKNSFVRKLEEEYTIYMGKDFWHRFTGDKDFYKDLIKASAEVASKVNMKPIVDGVIKKLSKSVEQRLKEISS